jgi:ADP-ribosylation factor GTPase-activating protein 2/3
MAAAFDAYTDKNAVFRRLKAKPENKVRAYCPALPWI